MSTENPRISNFIGLEHFDALFTKVGLGVFDGQQWSKLNHESDKLECAQELIPYVGLQIENKVTLAEWSSAAALAGLESADLDLIVVAEDPFLKQRDVLLRRPLGEFEELVELAGFEKRRSPSLMNSKSGLSIEAAIILRSGIEPRPGRPHRAGTRLTSMIFRVRSHPDAGGINPLPLTPEIISDNKLNTKTEIWVQQNGSLLNADVLKEAFKIYVSYDLLAALTLRRSGPEHDYIGSVLAVTACQQIALLLSGELSQDPTFQWLEEDERPVLSFILEKVNEGKPNGQDDYDRLTLVKLLREEPTLAASFMTVLAPLAKFGVQLLTQTGQEA